MRINADKLSLSSQRYLQNTQKAIARAFERLASGKRINSARDDAAGLAISTGLDSQVRGLSTAILNMNNSVGFLATADSAIATQIDITHRMRELAMQSANGTLSDKDRSNLNLEFQQLLGEYDRLASQTSFNGIKLLDGSFSTTSIQAGTKASDTFDLSLQSTRSDDVFQDRYSLNTFSSSQSITIGNTAEDILTGDFNNDGNVDVIGLNRAGSTISYLEGNGTGRFGSGTLTSITNVASPMKGVAADVDGDGNLDLILGSIGGKLNVALGNGTGTFQAAQCFTTNLTRIDQIQSGDFNGDGHLDIAAISATNTYISVMLGNGSGSFSFSQTLDISSNGGGIAVGDLDGDGLDDIVSSISTGASNSVFVHSSTGLFTSGTTFAVSGGWSGMALGDLNGDGKLDLRSAKGARLGNGDGTFGSEIFRADGSHRNILSDINQDGYLDEITNGGNNGVFVYYGNGDGTVQSKVTLFSSSTSDIGLGDFDGDGFDDIVSTSTATSIISTFLQNTVERAAGSDLNIATQTKAQNVLSIIDDGLETLSSRRANIGSLQNRLDFASDNNQRMLENISEARSQMVDADIAAETAELIRNQIFQSAGVSVLGQSNLQLNIVLELLRPLGQ